MPAAIFSMLHVPTVLIIGTFRSGTNAMLATLENNYHCSPTFNKYFWKHGLPPHHAEGFIPPDTKIICMVRDPVDFNKSLFRFWHARRKELAPSIEISKFIRDPLIVYDNTGGLDNINYHFNNPADYWNKFYFAWAYWKKIRSQLIFVRLEDFELNTKVILLQIEQKFALQRKPTWSPALPETRVGPSVPHSVAGLNAELSVSDAKFIRDNCIPELQRFFRYQ